MDFLVSLLFKGLEYKRKVTQECLKVCRFHECKIGSLFGDGPERRKPWSGRHTPSSKAWGKTSTRVLTFLKQKSQTQEVEGYRKEGDRVGEGSTKTTVVHSR